LADGKDVDVPVADEEQKFDQRIHVLGETLPAPHGFVLLAFWSVYEAG
jgi:hypothetical protein